MTLGRLALLLPMATQLLVWALVSLHRTRLGLGRLSARGTLVLAFLVMQVAVVVITELLSVGHLLTTGGVAAAWLVTTVVTAIVLVRTGGIDEAKRWQGGGGLGRTGKAVWSRPVVLLGLVVLVLIGATLVYTAWIYLPNNSDSLAYHLTRVVHWIQDRSVQHFATYYLWQIQLAPLHEYNMLHLQLLEGTDRLAGFPQLASFVVCVVGTGEIVRLLKGGAEVQVLAAVIAAATPALLLEATSTQNNLFTAAIGIGVVLLVLAWEPLQAPVVPALLLGAGVGLTAMSKGTAIPLVLPVAAALALRVVVAEVAAGSWTQVARRVALVGVLVGLGAAALIGPLWVRNHEVLGSVNGPVQGTLNDDVTPRAAAANTIRNVALQFRIGDDRSGIETETSHAILPVLRRAYRWTGEPANGGHLDYGQGEDAFAERDYRDFERNEDYGASPWFTLLLAVCLPIVLVRAIRGDASARTAALVVIGGVVGYVAFSATTKWTPYGSRYLLPLVVFGPPLIAIVLAGAHRYVLRGVAVAVVVLGLPVLVDSWARPLLDRPAVANDLDPYVVPRAGGAAPLTRASDYVDARDAIKASGCTRVGVGSFVLFEYLLWVGLDHVDWHGRIEHVGDVHNASQSLVDPDFRPCAVLQDAWGTALMSRTGTLSEQHGRLPTKPAGMTSKAYGSLTLWLPPDGAERAGWDVTTGV